MQLESNLPKYVMVHYPSFCILYSGKMMLMNCSVLFRQRVVVIKLPVVMLLELSLLAIKMWKPVLVDRPLGVPVVLTIRDTDRIGRRILSSGRSIGIGEWRALRFVAF